MIIGRKWTKRISSALNSRRNHCIPFPFKEGEMIAEGRIIQKGSSIAVGEMDVHDGKGAVYGKGIATYKL